MARLLLQLLGPFVATYDGEPLSRFRTKSAQALLIYLACQPEPHRRESLMALLWPNVAQASAQNSLRQALYHLRQAVPEVAARGDAASLPFLTADRQIIQVNPDAAYDLDVQAFERGLKGPQEGWPEAVALYRDDFLSDYYLPDSAPFEEWVAARRADFKRGALDALDKLTSLAMADNELEPAERYARRQLAIDNLRESAHRQLMEILVLSGQRSAALAQYDLCRNLLAEELAVDPSPKTRAIYERIRSAELGTAIIQAEQVRGYDLQEEIGAGSFGVVHRAYQAAVGREVAVKIIRTQYANHPDFIRRFEAEAQMVARLEHPHIVPLYDYWREPEGAYLVMRWLRGGNLGASLQANAWELAAAARLVDQIAGALASAHRQGVVHRDIKPANILLDEDGNGYLSDFGIAKDVTLDAGLTESGALLGSPAYVSPEQLLDEEITSLTDIYSLGVVLYELLTGRHPFPDASVAGLLNKHLHDPLPSVREQRPELPAAVDGVIQRATAKDPSQRFDDALAMALAFREAASGVAAIAVTPAELVNPYKGLRPFQEADAADFFGREALTKELLGRMRARPQDSANSNGRFLAVVGPSGSGKSSVVKAGLVPALRHGEVDGSQDWFVVEMMPGTHPLEELEAGLLRIAVNPPASLLGQIKEDERGLLRAVKRVLPGDEETELLLVVDQFEELFTLVEDKEERDFFLDSLHQAARDPRGRVRLVLTLRADFYDRPLSYPDFGELVRQHTTAIVPLSSDELGRAICAPAAGVGAEVAPELLAAIINDVSQQPGALPLLQYALTELFERRQGRTMTLAAYEAMGGVMGALGRRAEEIYASLDEERQEATRQFFLRLVTLGEGVEDTRRRVRRSELESLAEGGSQSSEAGANGHVSQVIDAFGRYRLLTFDRDPATRGPTVEVAHEALLREWDRLRGWLEESRDDVRWQRRLAAAAAEWIQAGRDDSFLLRGSRLEQFAGWAAEAGIALTQDEQGFLAASIAARETRQAAEEARRQRELETARQLAAAEKARAEEQSRAAQHLRRRAIYLAGVMVVAILFAVAAGLFGRQSNLNLNIAATNQAQAMANADLAGTRETEALANAQLAATREVEARDNADLAATSEAEAIANADLAEQAAIAEAAAAAEAQAQQAIAETNARQALEAYGQSLAAHAQNALENGDTAGGVALALAASDMAQPPQLAQRILRQAAYAPGPRRQYLVAELFPDVVGRIYSLAMSPVGPEALIGFEDGTLILWDTAAEAEIRRLAGHTGTVRAAAFSPDGQTALSGASDHAVVYWDLATGREIRRFQGHDGWVRTVAFSPDGRTAVSGGFAGDSVSSVADPGQLILWDLASGEEIRRFGGQEGGHPSGVVAAAFTPDGRAILASSGFWANVDNEYSLMLWDVETGQKIRDFEITGQTDNYSLAISPDGQTALTGNNSDEVIVWDMGTGQQIRSLNGHTGNMVTSVAYTPNGRRALSGDADGLLILWDLTSGEPAMRTGVQEPDVNWHASDDAVLNLVISSDGRTALSSAGDGTLVTWDLVDAGEIRRFEGHQTPMILSVAFTPDGKRALTTEWGDGFGWSFGNSNRLLLWDVETGQELRSFEGHTSGILGIAASADGRRALTGSQDGTMRLWDLDTGDEIRQILAHRGGVYAVALSPDGRRALSGAMVGDLPDSGITLWDLETGQVIHRLTDRNHFTTVAFGSDGQTAYAPLKNEEHNSSIGQYDLETGQLIRGYSAKDLCCTGFTVHPNGHSVFLASGSVIEWDLETDRQIRAFGQHTGTRTRVEVSPDGRLLLISAANAEGGILSLWDVESGQEIRRFSGDGICCIDIDMSPDGSMAITPAGGGTAILWDLTLPVEMGEVRDWIDDNRYVRPLSCADRERYRIEPLCEE